MVKFTALYFGPVKEALGKDREEITIDGQVTVQKFKQWLGSRDSQIASILGSSAMCINLEYVDDDDEIHDRDEVGIIPPVSSG